MRTRAAALAFFAAGLLAVPAVAKAQKTVFVVRHAEKISDTDERLTDAGRERARRLAAMLKDAGIGAIYATDTERARDTAGPLAGALGLKITIYDTGGGMRGPVDARPFVAMLRKEHARDVVLVVGHSNTIPDLLKALGCPGELKLAPEEYDNLFVVVPTVRAGRRRWFDCGTERIRIRAVVAALAPPASATLSTDAGGPRAAPTAPSIPKMAAPTSRWACPCSARRARPAAARSSRGWRSHPSCAVP